MRRCVVLGGGGHAKMVIEVLRCEGKVELAGVTDLRGGTGAVLGAPILGDETLIPGLARKGIHWFVVGVGGVPDNRPRSELYRRACGAGLKPLFTIHPSAVVAKSATIGPGTVVMPGVVINPDALLGANVIVNTRAVVEHDARIGDHVHVCPGAVLCGGCEVGQGAFIGAGAVLRQGVRVGDWSVVAAGAVVLTDVPPGGRVAGVPARPMARRGKSKKQKPSGGRH